MTKPVKSLILRRLLPLLGLVACLVAAVMVTPAEALPNCSCLTDYFSDPAQQNYVGTCVIQCSGIRMCDPGCPTPYKFTYNCQECCGTCGPCF